MSRSKSAGRETLSVIGKVDDLSSLWEALGFNSIQVRPSSSKSNQTKKGGDATDAVSLSSTGLSDEEALSTDEAEEQRKLWTQHVLADLSCEGRFLVLASQKEISVMTAKWKNDQLFFTKLWNGVLADGKVDTTAEVLTCCIVLPLLASSGPGKQHLAEWTCVVYGFKSGFVAFHTEMGYPVHRQQFDTHPVRSIKLVPVPSVGSSSRSVQQQELMVLYENGAVVFINGVHLYSSLQSLKFQAAAASSKGKGEDEDIETNSIPHEKFQLDSKQDIRDVASLGSSHFGLHEQLVNASVLGGPRATIKQPMPSFRRLVAVGTNPLYASYFIMEGETPLIIGQMAKDIAAKVGSAAKATLTATASRFGLQGLLNRAMPSAKDPGPEKKSKFVPRAGKRVEARSSLFDSRRIATSIVLSGTGRLAALTDNFGRVLLMECSSGVVVRMWKGYRSAELAWITVSDPKAQGPIPRFVECLVIYAPRRHLLELWSPMAFRRLVALHVNQGLRLLPVGTDAVGQPPSFRPSQCYFLDLAGNVYSLNVPFYLTEETVDRQDAHDMELLQQVKEKITGHGKKAMLDLVTDMKSWEVKDEAVSLLLNTSTSDSQLEVVKGIMRSQIAQADLLSEVSEKSAVPGTVDAWKRKLQLLDLHSKLIHLVTRQSTSAISAEDGKFLEECGVTEALFITMRSIDRAKQPSAATAPLSKDPVHLAWKKFLDVLVWNEDQPDAPHLRLSCDRDDPALLTLCQLLFLPYFQRKIGLQELMLVLGDFNREPLLDIFFHFWLNMESHRPFGLGQETMRLLCGLLKNLIGEASPLDVRHYRSLLQECSDVPAALLVCIAVVAVCFQPHHLRHLDPDMDDADWETVCKEKVEWARLSQRLESLLSLQAFLCRFLVDGKRMEEALLVSVADATRRGKHFCCEYLSAWTAGGFINLPPTVVMKSLHSDQYLELPFFSAQSEELNDRPLRFLHIPQATLEEKELKDSLIILRAIFPKSLTTDTLLANCAWELAVLWHKRPEEMHLLQKSRSYLTDIVKPQLSHGVALLMWKTFVEERIKTIASLMEKVGKAPKERLFMRDVAMTEESVEELLALSFVILGHVYDAEYDQTAKINEKADVDDLWRSDGGTGGKKSLVQVALAQPVSTAPLVRHHMHLMTVLELVLHLNVKSTRPLSLFDFKAREAFFQDFTTHPLLSILDLDQNTIRARNQFVTRCVNGLVRSAWEHGSLPEVEWLERISDLASYWNMPTDYVQSAYVYELYSHGLDSLAEEAYKGVVDKQPLLSRLVTLAGQRLAVLTLSEPERMANYLSSMSPLLGSYIRQQDANLLAESKVEWQRCYLLVRNLSHDLAATQAEHKLVSEMVEWMKAEGHTQDPTS